MRGKKKGFTMVELIVVIAIIAIIAAIAVPSTIGYVNKAKKSMADNETLNLMNLITESMALIASEMDGRVARDTFQSILDEQMPNVEYVTEVIVAQDGDSQLKVTIKAGDLSQKEQTFNYSSYYLQWGEESVSQFTFTPTGSGDIHWVAA